MMAPTPMTQALEHFLEAAWHRTAVLNRKMIGLAHSNLRFGFELARAKTLSDVLSLQADYWQKHFNAFQAEDFETEFSEPAEPERAETREPQRAEAREAVRIEPREPSPAEEGKAPTPDQDPVPVQAEAKTVEVPVPADAPEKAVTHASEKPRRQPAHKPMPKAAAPDPQGERKSAKGRTKPAHGRPSSSDARAAERKGRAPGHDAAPPSGTGKIQFGMLDGNAVRFNIVEAWALLDGTWKRVSVEEVLSDAAVLSQARFEQRYPEVPQLPASAFRPKGKQNR